MFKSYFENKLNRYQSFTTNSFSYYHTLHISLKAYPWATEEMVKYGGVEYDPANANISNFHPSLWFTGLQEELVFYGVMTEMHIVGAPVVKLTVEVEEDVVAKNTVKLKQILES